jgi:hypothetical protein
VPEQLPEITLDWRGNPDLRKAFRQQQIVYASSGQPFIFALRASFPALSAE